ncbi:MAG TPA: chromate transporter [Tepidiformaceae bacterium]
MASVTVPKQPTLFALFKAFLIIGVTSFGGGRAAYFQDALVTRRKWITDEEFLEAVAVSQVLPGPNIGNLSAYLGQRLRGWRGAVIAMLCLTVPGGLAIVAMAWLYFNGMPASITGPVGKGVAAAAAGLAAAAVVRLRGGTGGAGGWAVAGLTFVLFGPLGWPILLVLAVCLPPSFAVAWSRHK